MENKEMIIDGVDVSGCKNFSCGKCEEENKIPITINHFTADCRMYPNCYYKQLKRKEQECERLKLDLIEARAHGDYLNNSALSETLKIVSEQCDQLKAENDELKEKVKELRQGWINCDNERNLQEANSEFRQRVINRYKQTLMEIEEIAKNMNNECFYDDFDCEVCDMKNGCTYQGKIKILQKISKVENE